MHFKDQELNLATFFQLKKKYSNLRKRLNTVIYHNLQQPPSRKRITSYYMMFQNRLTAGNTF